MISPCWSTVVQNLGEQDKPNVMRNAADGPLGGAGPETVRRAAIQLVKGREDAHAWDRLLARPHYLGRSRLVGETEVRRCGGRRAGDPRGMGQCRLQGGRPAPALGWTPVQRDNRLRQVVKVARFAILPPFGVANLGSHALGLTCAGSAQTCDPWPPAVGVCDLLEPAPFLGTVDASTGCTPGETAGGPQHPDSGRPPGAGGGAGHRPRLRHRRWAPPAGGRGAPLLCGMPGYRALGPWAQNLIPTRAWVVPSLITL